MVLSSSDFLILPNYTTDKGTTRYNPCLASTGDTPEAGPQEFRFHERGHIHCMVGAHKVTNILKQRQLLKEANWRAGYQWISGYTAVRCCGLGTGTLAALSAFSAPSLQAQRSLSTPKLISHKYYGGWHKKRTS